MNVAIQLIRMFGTKEPAGRTTNIWVKFGGYFGALRLNSITLFLKKMPVCFDFLKPKLNFVLNIKFILSKLVNVNTNINMKLRRTSNNNNNKLPQHSFPICG